MINMGYDRNISYMLLVQNFLLQNSNFFTFQYIAYGHRKSVSAWIQVLDLKGIINRKTAVINRCDQPGQGTDL